MTYSENTFLCLLSLINHSKAVVLNRKIVSEVPLVITFIELLVLFQHFKVLPNIIQLTQGAANQRKVEKHCFKVFVTMHSLRMTDDIAGCLWLEEIVLQKMKYRDQNISSLMNACLRLTRLTSNIFFILMIFFGKYIK